MIEENLVSPAKSIERLGIQAEKQQQLLLKYVEGIAKEKMAKPAVGENRQTEHQRSKLLELVDLAHRYLWEDLP